MATLVNQLQPTTESNYVSLDVAIGTAGEPGTIITIDSEQMLVRDGLGTTGLDVERGVNGTTIAAHSVGATVSVTREAGAVYVLKRNFVPAELQNLNTSPITLVPAPADKMVVLHSYAYKAVVTAPFDSGNSPYLSYTDFTTSKRYAYLGASSITDYYLTETGTVAYAAAPRWQATELTTGMDFRGMDLVLNSDGTATESTATMTLELTYTLADVS